MGNFCTNCGTEIRKEDNFCTNCGIKLHKSEMKDNKSLSKSKNHSIEKDRITKEREKLKMIDELFESKEIKSEITKNKIDQTTLIYIKDILKIKIINKQENMIKGEIKYLIKTELKKASKNPEQIRIAEKNEETRKQLKMIDELFESEEIKSEITKNKINQITVISIKDIIKSKVINKREKIDKEEIESIIKTELIEAIKEQREIRIEEKKEINMKRIAEMNSKKNRKK